MDQEKASKKKPMTFGKAVELCRKDPSLLEGLEPFYRDGVLALIDEKTGIDTAGRGIATLAPNSPKGRGKK